MPQAHVSAKTSEGLQSGRLLLVNNCHVVVVCCAKEQHHTTDIGSDSFFLLVLVIFPRYFSNHARNSISLEMSLTREVAEKILCAGEKRSGVTKERREKNEIEGK